MAAKSSAPSPVAREQASSVASKPMESSERAVGIAAGQRNGLGTPSSIVADPLLVEEWNFSSGMKIFYLGSKPPGPLTGIGFLPMPPERQLPGYVCQAARGLLNVSQAWLWQQASVSRKTINDFENGFSSPKPALNLRIRRALEVAGAQFVFGEDVVGVIVYSSKSEAAQRSRSDKLRGK